MEERDGKNESPSLTLPPLQASPPLPLTETYVVQIPRDQVYRVPPPENAQIVENYRKPAKEKNPCGGQCCCVMSVVVAVMFFVCIFIVIVHLMYKPKVPEFSVNKIRAKNHLKEYDIRMEMHNPNGRMKVSLKGGGKSNLQFKHSKIAKGGVPTLTQGANGMEEFSLIMHGLKVLSGIKKGLEDSKKKVMKLEITVPIKISSWAKTKKMDITVACVLKVDTLTKKKTEILSQECQTTH